MRHVPAANAVFTVLFVCTGNVCRSALAERLARAWLDEELGDAAAGIRLESAGTRAVVGSAMHPDTALVLHGLGARAGDFRARQVTEAHLAGADLVLTMTRAHRHHVLGLAPRAMGRTFTLPEAAALLDHIDAALPLAGDQGSQRARSLVRALTDARSRRMSLDTDDVLDPIHRPLEVHEEVGARIAATVIPLLRRIADLHDTGSDAERDISRAVHAAER